MDKSIQGYPMHHFLFGLKAKIEHLSQNFSVVDGRVAIDEHRTHLPLSIEPAEEGVSLLAFLRKELKVGLLQVSLTSLQIRKGPSTEASDRKKSGTGWKK